MKLVTLGRYDVINAEVPVGLFVDSRYTNLQGTVISDKDGKKYLQIGKGKDTVLKFGWGVRFHGDRSLKKIDIDLESLMADAKLISKYKVRYGRD